MDNATRVKDKASTNMARVSAMALDRWMVEKNRDFLKREAEEKLTQ